MMREKQLKTLWLYLITFVMVYFLTMTAYAFSNSADADDDRRVFDQAGLLKEDEIEAFEQEISEIRNKAKIDVVVVTADDTGSKTTTEYADDFYNYNGFGFGEDYSGVLFLIDMDNRQITISTAGIMRRYLTDSRIETMLDRAYPGIKSGQYGSSIKSFLKDTRTYYQKGIQAGQYLYDTETGKISVYRSIRWYEALLAVGASIFTAWISCVHIINQYSMKKQRKQASDFNLAYRADCQLAMNHQSDRLLNKHVSQTIIPRSNSSGGGGSSSGRSSTHTSSSGRSHGGGSRGF